MLLGKRPKENVDRSAGCTGLLEWKRGDGAVGDLQPPIWRDDIDVVAFQFRLVLDLRHRHLRARRQDAGQFAPGARIKVDDDNEGRTGIGRHVFEEGLKCLHAPCRGSDANYRRIEFLIHAQSPRQRCPISHALGSTCLPLRIRILRPFYFERRLQCNLL
ncbi:hypothetical protein ABIA16_004244 [Sinorhizobium fredii]